MGNEVSAQRVTFGSHSPRPPYKQVQQEASPNTDAPSTNKRKREDSEEDHSSENVSKHRKLHQNENSGHSTLNSESLIVILKCDSLSSLQTVSQQKDPMRTKKNKEENNAHAVLNRYVKRELEYINREKQKRRRLRKQREKAMASTPGRDPIGTPSSADLQATTSTVPPTHSVPIAPGTNLDSKIKEKPEITVKSGLKASPDTNASTGSPAQIKD
ncbi:uncharacterized protein EAE98_006197 [Botrytis deweyae]|uniref:Uncharacterized protein n=1 Tax=Botrytis deweyae TaxID=2478750 RepID=A0ABQ7IK67_9HELO|nr:uncharacterized protein EAE98_006197 [Botrytis deweyae]KAF7926812.1 hypothetical protein EAE98_006197 [Botrytis deweyae]